MGKHPKMREEVALREGTTIPKPNIDERMVLYPRGRFWEGIVPFLKRWSFIPGAGSGKGVHRKYLQVGSSN